jgi:HTH-type transcriptional regulator / antitoxin HigA
VISDQPRPAPYIPDEPSAPGEALRDRLKELAMSQADLAARSNLSTKHVNQIVQGVAPITHETALILERVTGTPARVWNALEAAYRDTQARDREKSRPARADQAWLKSLPIRELRERGLISTAGKTADVRQEMLAFFGVADRAAWERLWLEPDASFRRSRVFQSHPGAVATWLRAGEFLAISRKCEPFDSKAFRELLHDARRFTRDPASSLELVQTCAHVGVALVFVKEFVGSRTSGAARWLTPDKAMIVLSDRHKREDSFWFSFFHEGGHLLMHSKRETFIRDRDKQQGDRVEAEADRFAQDLLIPRSHAHRLPSLGTPTQVVAFAEEIGISPGIVVGRLHNDELWRWNQGRDLIRTVRIVEHEQSSNAN